MTAHIEWAWKGTKSATVTSLHVAGKTILVNFNLAVSALIAKPPILIPCQIFRLYGILLPSYMLSIENTEKKVIKYIMLPHTVFLW